MNRKCETCGVELKPTQYARKVKLDGTHVKASEVLVCRNYPDCPKAEKEVKQ